MSELIKLLLILGGGLLVIVIGFIIQRKQIAKKKAELDMMSQDYNSENEEDINEAEKSAKLYINTYKNQFPKESIKNGLIQAGNNEDDIEIWINKYF